MCAINVRRAVAVISNTAKQRRVDDGCFICNVV